MALERLLSAVPPTPLISNGGIEGTIQVADTIGLYVKQNITLQAPLLPPLTVQIKRVVDNQTIFVGPPGPSMTHRVDVSAYTVAAGSFLYAAEQPRPTLSIEQRDYASYETEPINAWRTKSVDPYGNPYTDSNPEPVNIFPGSQIPFSLGSLAIPALISQYIATLTYDEVVSSTIGTEEILKFFEGGTEVGEIDLTQSPAGWTLNLGVPEEDFLLLETGFFFVLESGTGGILLE